MGLKNDVQDICEAIYFGCIILAERGPGWGRCTALGVVVFSSLALVGFPLASALAFGLLAILIRAVPLSIRLINGIAVMLFVGAIVAQSGIHLRDAVDVARVAVADLIGH